MSDGLHVLIVDDDIKLCGIIHDYLSAFDMKVECAYNGGDGLGRIADGGINLVLLDMALPDMDGLDILRTLSRTYPDLPIIIISAQSDSSDRIVGLEMGADDFVPKTFSPRELLVRIRTVARRALPQIARNAAVSAPTRDDRGILRCRGLELDTRSGEARLEDRELELSRLQFQLLLLFVSNPGRVFSRDELMAHLSGRDCGAMERSIDMHVSSLRRKLGDSPYRSTFIRTVHGEGYLFMK